MTKDVAKVWGFHIECNTNNVAFYKNEESHRLKFVAFFIIFDIDFIFLCFI